MAKDGDDGYIHLEYRYNTYGDVTKRCLNGAVSFNLNSLDLTGKKGIKVKLNSVENGEVEVVFDVKEQPIPEGAKNIELSMLYVCSPFLFAAIIFLSILEQGQCI